MRMSRAVRAIVRLEISEVRRSRWLFVCAGLYVLLASLFLVIGLRESNVIGFTGMGRVLASLGHALVVLLPLVALTGTALVINRARESGSLELLFGQPLTRSQYVLALTIVRLGALLLPLIVLMPAVALAGQVAFHQPVPWAFVARALAISAALLWAFVGIGLALSTVIREPARAMVYLLGVWALAVALLDFGLIGAMLQWRLRPDVVFAIAALNPVEAARVGLLAGADASLDSLGPVGLFLARRLGSTGLLVSAIAWPGLLGTMAWLFARRSLRAADVV
jgi:ABC-2 type transport system permease protein